MKLWLKGHPDCTWKNPFTSTNMPAKWGTVGTLWDLWELSWIWGSGECHCLCSPSSRWDVWELGPSTPVSLHGLQSVVPGQLSQCLLQSQTLGFRHTLRGLCPVHVSQCTLKPLPHTHSAPAILTKPPGACCLHEVTSTQGPSFKLQRERAVLSNAYKQTQKVKKKKKDKGICSKGRNKKNSQKKRHTNIMGFALKTGGVYNWHRL